MKKQWKKLKKRLSGTLLPGLISLLLRGLYATMDVKVIGGEMPQASYDRGEGTIIVFWHARLLMLPFVYTGKRIYVLISSHGDGEIIATVMKGFGFGLVRGSSSRGGKKAFLNMVKLSRGNNDLAITPDGPRGPAEQVKLGVARLALVSGKPVIPLAFSSSWAKRFASWDRFMIPYPFSRGVFIWGEPLHAHQGEEPEAFRLRIEEALKSVTARADGYFRQ